MAFCNWCGEDLSGAPRGIFWDKEGNKYCTKHCLDNAIVPFTDEDEEISDDDEDED